MDLANCWISVIIDNPCPPDPAAALMIERMANSAGVAAKDLSQDGLPATIRGRYHHSEFRSQVLLLPRGITIDFQWLSLIPVMGGNRNE